MSLQIMIQSFVEQAVNDKQLEYDLMEYIKFQQNLLAIMSDEEPVLGKPKEPWGWQFN